MTATIDEIAKTVAEFETRAIATGARAEFDAPEFTADGVTWAQVWFPEDPPAAGRATVRRDGAVSTVVVRWADAVPADDEWRELWHRRPMPLFGAYLRRDAIRHAFRDVVASLTSPDDNAHETPATGEPRAPRNWADEYRAATEVDQLDGIRRDCRAARENTLELQELWRSRRAEIVAAAWSTPAPELSEDEAIRHRAFFEQPEQPERTRPVPQDHLPPTNRAARRASKRKGRR